MNEIAQPSGEIIPTWSWFSKEGSIRYMDLEFEKVTWSQKDFEFPLHKSQENATLSGLARRVSLQKEGTVEDITFDMKTEIDLDALRCVVIGRDKEKHDYNSPRVHVLVIKSSNQHHNTESYRRVGVASLLEEHIGAIGSWVNIV